MSYTALYRKFRPAEFEDVKGQEHIVTTLQNQIKANRIGHAYLFCGTRGTGKTTVAKIFAKAVNCEHPVNGSPCGECAMCKSIAAGTSMNVIEIDAASNNGVDNIREIREEVTYRPTEGKYKVYIIDEVHMLSIGAFNALLKTLEEPPEYVIFILATTEVHKIPITILSRCQHYDFKRISIETITARMQELMDTEQIEVEDKALRYIAKAADGSMRDALSLLDQCIAFYLGQKLTYDHVLEVLGAVDTDVFSKLLRNVIGRDVAAVLDIVEKDLESEAKEVQTMKPGAKVLPHFIKDTTDRNRTSPFAFTGNKFEFRMPGSALSVSEPNIVINTAVAEVLGEFADRLEGLSGKALEAEIHLLLKEVLRDHRHIVFNGNGYTSEWVEEAHKRGLFDLPSCAEAFPRLIAEKNVELFLKHGIYTKEELFSRYEIKEENYIKTINIEAKTMLSMMKKTFLPSVLSYCKELAETAAKTKAILPDAPISAESKLLEKLSGLYTEISEKTEALAEAEKAAESMEDNIEKVAYFHYTILAKMDDLRSSVDTAEALIPDSFLPYPTYDELLFSV